MKNIFFVLSVFCVLLPSAHAMSDVGIGAILGVPSGVNARYWLESNQSIEANLGWSIINSNKFMLNTSFLWNKNDVFEVQKETFDFFYGIGIGLRTKSGVQDGEVVLGPRIPVGVNYFLDGPKIEFFSECGINIGIIPSSDLYLDAGVGVRFYFE